ncbi:MAG: alkaline phosphatase family protein [Clostridia bacterium]|nr:alkaline phosphatase family protein [Clostridia bacterium]
MKIKYPEYGRCIANLACSLLKYYGIEPPNPTFEQADALLEKKYKNIVLILLDGMGMNILEKHLAEDGFFRKNLRFDYSSTFPPTTVAATTAVTSGLYPNQSAWLGWVGYFAEIDRNVVYFFNRDNDTQETIRDFSVTDRFVPYEKLSELIRKTGVQACELAPWYAPYPKTYGEMCAEIARLCSTGEGHFIYAYCEQPDKAMHELGTDDARITDILTQLEHQTQTLAERLQDTLLLITADHGMVNTRCEVLADHPDVADCLLRTPSIESRAVNFFVRPEKKNDFERAFKRDFGDNFLLMSKEEVLGRQLFGTGKDHLWLSTMLGDYLAVAVGELTLRTRDKGYIGEHAGLLQDEMTIPLIAIEKE